MGFSGEQSCLRSITIYRWGRWTGEEQRTARMCVRVIFLQVTDTVYYHHTYRRVKISLAKAGTIR
jgi:hypothetical protein